MKNAVQLLAQISFLSLSVLIAVTTSNAHADTLQSQWNKESATYEVPAPADLAPLANFEMTNLVSRTRNGRVEMKYTLPQELTGEKIEVRVRADRNNPNLLTGPLGHMECSGDDCAVHYPNADIYNTKVAKFLIDKGFSGTELDERLKVAQLFKSGDPAGVVHFRRKAAK